MDDERVAKIVDARPATARLRLEARGADDEAQELFGSDVRVATRLVAEQPRIGLLREPGPCSQFEVVAEGGHNRRLDRQSAGLEELGLADLERVLPGPEITQFQPDDLAHPQADAVAQDDHGVERRRTQWSVRRWELACRAQQEPDLFARIDVRAAPLSEHGLLQQAVESRRSRDLLVDPLQGSQ